MAAAAEREDVPREHAGRVAHMGDESRCEAEPMVQIAQVP